MNPQETLFQPSTRCLRGPLAALIIVSLCGSVYTAHAQGPSTEKVLYNFSPATGYNPTGPIRDAAGNFYVATDFGVDNQQCSHGCGSILQLSPSGQANVLYAFGYYGFDKAGPGPTTP